MGKSKKKKNEKVKDFVKPKLKVGRKLQPQNTTQTTFKTRSIILPSQLQSPPAELPLSQRKQPMQVLLSQLRHYNANVRHDALIGIRDIAMSHLNYVVSNLSNILERVTECLTDTDARVRHQLCIILADLLIQIPSPTLSPFVNRIVARLCCGLTHIEHDIRLDTLKVLDIFLDNFPTLIAANSKDLLPIIVDLISQQCNTLSDSLPVNKNLKLKSTSNRSKNSNLSQRTLTVRLKGNLNIHQIRQRILLRLRKFLSSLYNDNVADGESNASSKLDSYSQKQQSIHFKHNPWSLESQFRSDRNVEYSKVFINGEELQHIVDTLMPLLINIWVECNPAKLSQDRARDEGLLEVLLLLMQEVLLLIQLLCQVVHTYHEQLRSGAADWTFNDVLGRYYDDLVLHCFKHFPFAIAYGGRSKRSRDITSMDRSNTLISDLNISICNIIAIYAGYVPLCELPEFKVVINCIERAMQSPTSSNFNNLMRTAENLIKSLSSRHNNTGGNEHLKEILLVLHQFYNCKYANVSCKAQCLKLLRNLLREEQKQVICGSTGYVIAQLDEWLLEMPEDLLELSSDSTDLGYLIVDIIKACLLSGFHKRAILSRLNNLLPQYFDQSAERFLGMPTRLRRSFIEIFYHCDIFDKSLLKKLSLICHRLSVSVCTYMLDVIFERFMSEDVHVTASVTNYLSFLLSITSGTTRQKLLEFKNKCGAQSNRFIFSVAWNRETFICKNSKTSEDDFWEIHKAILKHVIWQLSHLRQNQHILVLFEKALQTFLDTYSCLPIQTAFGVLVCVKGIILAGTKNLKTTKFWWTELLFASVQAASATNIIDVYVNWQPELFTTCISLLKEHAIMREFLQLVLRWHTEATHEIFLYETLTFLLQSPSLRASFLANQQLLLEITNMIKLTPEFDKMSHRAAKFLYAVSLIIGKC